MLPCLSHYWVSCVGVSVQQVHQVHQFSLFFKKVESKLGSNDQLLNDAHLWMPLLRRQLKELTRTWRRFEVVQVVVILPKLRTTFWGLSLFALRVPDLEGALVSEKHSFVVLQDCFLVVLSICDQWEGNAEVKWNQMSLSWTRTTASYFWATVALL